MTNTTREVPALGTDGLPYHTQPLRALVKELHKGRTLADNVRRLRWRRRKVKVTEGEGQP